MCSWCNFHWHSDVGFPSALMDLGLAKPSGFLPEFQDEAGVGTKVPGDKKVKISISAHLQRTARHS